jgi:hypothetical protein
MSERSERFFAWLWRINGVLLLVLGLVAVVGAGALFFNIGLFWSRDRPEQRLTRLRVQISPPKTFVLETSGASPALNSPTLVLLRYRNT